MSKAVIHYQFGGPEVLNIVDIPEPHAHPNEVRIRVSWVGLNPLDWRISRSPEMAQEFGISLPSGFGSDFAGIVDEAGPSTTGYAVGQRVYGAAIGRGAAEFVTIDPSQGTLWHTPESLSDDLACTLPVAGLTASAALSSINVSPDDTVLIGGAAGGVGVFAVQLAKLIGARVIGTCSPSTFEFVRQLGAEPVAYGPDLSHRIQEQWPREVTSAADLFGRETVNTALQLGVAPQRISAIADGPALPEGVHETGAFHADPASLNNLAEAVSSQAITVPIAASFPFHQIREAVSLQSGGHAHGKITVSL